MYQKCKLAQIISYLNGSEQNLLAINKNLYIKFNKTLTRIILWNFKMKYNRNYQALLQMWTKRDKILIKRQNNFGQLIRLSMNLISI